MSIKRQTVSFLERFCLHIVSSKCGKSENKNVTRLSRSCSSSGAFKRVTSLLLLTVLFISSFSINSSAVDYNDSTIPIISSEINQSNTNSPDNVYDYSSSIVLNQTSSGGIPVTEIYNSNSNFYSVNYTKTTVIKNNFSVKGNHNYTVKFKTGLTANIEFHLNCYVYVFDGNGNNVSTIFLFQQYNSGPNNTYFSNRGYTEFDFNLSNSDLPSGYSLKFGIDIITPKTQSHPYRIYITDISYVDNDDNSGLLNSIITAIGVVWNSIKDGFESMSQGFSNLTSRMGTWFTNLGNSIGGFFTNLWNNIKGGFADVGRWFTDLGNKIGVFFVNLYNDIINGLKNLFIPSDGYFDSKKSELSAFCTQHFGAVYQAPGVMIDLIRKFLVISPGTPAITMPAIEFDLLGTHYVLTDSITYSFDWVNDSSHPLFYFYKFYQGFVSLIFFLFFGNYCLKKYNVIFGGAQDDN